MDKETLLTAMTALRHYHSQQLAYAEHYYRRREVNKALSAENFAKRSKEAYNVILIEADLKSKRIPPVLIQEVYDNATVHLEI